MINLKPKILAIWGSLTAFLLALVAVFKYKAKAAENRLDAVESQSKTHSLETQKAADDAAREAGAYYESQTDENVEKAKSGDFSGLNPRMRD